MKRTSAKPEYKADHDSGKATATTTVPFGENRYRKYRFQREDIAVKAPESSGVYGLYSALWIFIDEAENIRARLLEHLTGDNPCINRHRPSGFAFELVSPEDRVRRRDELINELEPTCPDGRSHSAPAPDAGSGISVPSIDASQLDGALRLPRGACK